MIHTFIVFSLSYLKPDYLMHEANSKKIEYDQRLLRWLCDEKIIYHQNENIIKITARDSFYLNYLFFQILTVIGFKMKP